jgi:PEP-CTERM motif-containing protein
MRTFHHLAAVAVLMLAAAPVSASTIALGTSSHSGFTSMQPEGSPQWGAQAFTLTSALDLAAFELGFVHTAGFTSRVQLVQGGSPGVGTTLFDTTFSDAANPGLAFLYESYSFAVPMTLLPGSYYIVATNELSQNFGWSFGTTQVPSTFGTIGEAFACLDANSESGCNAADPKTSTEWVLLNINGLPLDFRLIEQEPTATAMPEPGTLLLLGGGLVGSAARFRKRRQSV